LVLKLLYQNISTAHKEKTIPIYLKAIITEFERM